MILEKLMAYGHAGISEGSKVNYFKRGITDPVLDPVKASLACQVGAATFDSVVTTYRTYQQSIAAALKTVRPTVNVSAISSYSGNRTSDHKNKIGEKEDGYDQSKDYSNYHVKPRFYKTGEWNALKKGERNYLRTTSKNKANKSNKDGNLKRKIKYLVAKVASLQAKAKTMRISEAGKSTSTSTTSTDSGDDNNDSNRRMEINPTKRNNSRPVPCDSTRRLGK